MQFHPRCNFVEQWLQKVTLAAPCNDLGATARWQREVQDLAFSARGAWATGTVPLLSASTPQGPRCAPLLRRGLAESPWRPIRSWSADRTPPMDRGTERRRTVCVSLDDPAAGGLSRHTYMQPTQLLQLLILTQAAADTLRTGTSSRCLSDLMHAPLESRGKFTALFPAAPSGTDSA